MRPTRPGLVLRPARPGLVLRPARPGLVLRPARPGLVLRPARPGLVLRPARPGLVLRPARPGLSVWTRDWARSVHLKTDYYPVVDSTNSAARRFFLKRLTKSSAAGAALFIAEKQLAGRGQDGKIWLDSDLTASFLWITATPAGRPERSRSGGNRQPVATVPAGYFPTEANLMETSPARRSLTNSTPAEGFSKQTEGRISAARPLVNRIITETKTENALKDEESQSLTEQFAEDLQEAALATWPAAALTAKGNDLMRKGKKIAGILLEYVQSAGEEEQVRQKALIAGLGVNVFSHPPFVGAGRLAEDGALKEKEWRLFLSRLHKLWTLRSARFLIKTVSL